MISTLSLTDARNANQKNRGIVNMPKPFLKWVGGKRQLLAQYEPFLIRDSPLYIEPFVGGGAIFFYLLPDRSVLMDTNPELMNCYRVIQQHPQELIKKLREFHYEASFFYEIRQWDREFDYNHRDPIERASRTIFLNKTCYNGLYRVNKRGQFNAPFGKYDNPLICDEENIIAVHSALQKVLLVEADFQKVVEYAIPNAFIYLDPPYDPIAKTANFTSYTNDKFTLKHQQTLASVYKNLDQKCCKVMLSNSDTDYIRELYAEFTIHEVSANRAINCKGKKRGTISELVIVNY